MARRGTIVVRAVALLSVLTSAVALEVAARAGHALPSETGNLAVIGAGAAVLAVVLHHRTPTNNLWRVLLVIAVNGPLAVVLSATAAATRQPTGALLAALWLLDVVLAVPWVLLAGLFPDGHRPMSPWTRLVVLGALLLFAASVAAWLTAPSGAPVPVPGHLPGRVSGTGLLPGEGAGLHQRFARTASLLTGVLPLAALGALMVRYRRSGPVVRQQIRVGIAGLAISIVLEIALRILPGAQEGRLQLVGTVLAVGLGQLAIAAALLRWRLWVVDQALPRAVVLGSCSAAFTGVIVAGALLLTGQVRTSQVRAAVVAAAVVTVLVQGYSRRLEPWVRRLVYGQRPSGFGVLVGLADGLSTLDDQAAAARIAEAVRRGLAVPWVALWTATARQQVYRLVTTAGDVTAAPVVQLGGEASWDGPPVRLLDPPAAQMAPSDDPWPRDTAALALLGAPPSAWAVLAVGQRRGDPLTPADLELLEAIVRASELARANARLTDQVAASVEELQANALQLQVSRQRLVSAQDEERRRIERDLHDGAQHELISLAGELHQLARAPSVDPSALLDLAGKAERAVFSLQDLARGIYPSVLTDHGLAAAIRSFAGRLPVDVTLDVDPEITRRRWPTAVEVALYFVAVESLGNSRKHAAATRTSVTLTEDVGQLVLEVHDNGVGLGAAATQRSAGSGVQHMTDRMAALGGRLTIVGRQGEGTWVIASVPTGPAVRGRTGPSVTGRLLTPGGRAGPPAPGG